MQAMTVLKRFAWKQIAVYLLDTFVLGITKYHQALNNCTERNGPCALLIPAIPMSPTEQ
jgi:hypothetical protein